MITALDLFAGTGWGVACRRLNIREMGVELMPEAIATRDANGMATIYRDVWEGLTGSLYVPKYQLLIASPPCQTFSMAGNGAGRAALDEVIEAIQLHAYQEPAKLLEFGERHDMRTALVLTPLAHVWRDRPEYVVFEQVPTVLPVWEACAEIMRELGYDVKTAVLNAEQYGVPQTRKRAILVARLTGPAKLPTPTHSRYYPTKPGQLDIGVLPWISMAEALGWGFRDQPAATITGGGGKASGIELWDQGSRRKALAAIQSGSFTPNGRTVNPATPLDPLRMQIEEAAALQTFPVGRGLTNRPSPTITGGGTETGGAEPIAKYHSRYTNQPEWVGSKERLSTQEAATLQTYPPGPSFIWCGSKSKQFLQIGNAVPPLLAQVVLTALVE